MYWQKVGTGDNKNDKKKMKIRGQWWKELVFQIFWLGKTSVIR